MMEGIPEHCTACDAPLSGQPRCGACGKVHGAANLCPSCGNYAAVRQLSRHRSVCSACGKPRVVSAGTVLESNVSMEIRAASRRDRIIALFAGISGVGLFGSGALLFGLGVGLFDGWLATLLGSIGGGLALFGAAGLWWARSRRASAQGRETQAREAALLSAAATPDGVTAQAAAHALSLDAAGADAELTRLAKQGRVDMDVDDEGVVRYRVAEPAPSFEEEALEQQQLEQRRGRD